VADLASLEFSLVRFPLKDVDKPYGVGFTRFVPEEDPVEGVEVFGIMG